MIRSDLVSCLAEQGMRLANEDRKREIKKAGREVKRIFRYWCKNTNRFLDEDEITDKLKLTHNVNYYDRYCVVSKARIRGRVKKCLFAFNGREFCRIRFEKKYFFSKKNITVGIYVIDYAYSRRNMKYCVDKYIKICNI